MPDRDNNGPTSDDRPIGDGRKPLGELRLKGTAVARGIALGRLLCFYGTNHQFYRSEIPEKLISNEIERLRKAVDRAARQLASLSRRKKGEKADPASSIFEAHLMLASDPTLFSRIEAEIRDTRTNAEWAVRQVADSIVAKYRALEDENLRDRYIDIEDVSERILAALGGELRDKVSFKRGSILAGRELMPSTLIDVINDGPLALITENGGWTSHTFILAREMNWPAVTGLKNVMRRVRNGDQVIVDGYNGLVILRPNVETLRQYKDAVEPTIKTAPASEGHPSLTKTLDGRAIKILANTDSTSGYRRAKEAGAEGIGLYRSENLLGRSGLWPSEAEQVRAYAAIAAAAGEDGVKIRTFDVAAEKLIDQGSAREKNPALGLRAIRLGLQHPKLLRTQLRAVLRACCDRKVDLVIPMVSGVSEIRAVRSLLEEVADSLRSKGKPFSVPRVGAMIEVPSAVLTIDQIVAETDFVCLGTNDLIQYLLAVDRDNESAAHWYRSLHPAVLKAVRAVIDAASAAGKAAIVCGEMAGSPYYVPVLIGLGASQLSMNVNSIARVKRVVAGIAREEASEMVAAIESALSVEDAEVLFDQIVRAKWKHLFPPDFSLT